MQAGGFESAPLCTYHWASPGPCTACLVLKFTLGSPQCSVPLSSGKVGRLYGAKTTPHMFIIDPNGVLIYNGAIDDKPSTDQADIPNSTNYVSEALSEAMGGRPVSNPNTRPYGCSVKYRD